MLQQLFQMFSDAVLSQLDNYDVKDKPEFKPASRVRRDSEGRSARERSFEWFDEGCRPSQLPDLGVKPRTLYRYFQSWKHLERDLDLRLRTRLLRHVPGIEANYRTGNEGSRGRGTDGAAEPELPRRDTSSDRTRARG